MKKEKGFTLVEMISVLVIMSVLFMISFPSILNAVKSTSIKLNDAEKIIVEDAITDYLNNNDTYEQNNGDNYCVSISSLLEEGYLTEEEVTEFDKDSIVNVIIENGKIKIELNEICINQTKQVYFRLRGSKSMEINKGHSYTEQGVGAKDKDNNDVSDQVIIKYYDKDMHEIASINTQFLGNYIVEYILELDGKKYVLERNIKVTVNEDPIISHPGDTNIRDYILSFDLLDGVTATDFENNDLDILVKTNLTLGIVGNYSVEYTVVDKYNNKVTAVRKVNVIESHNELILNGVKPELDDGMIPVTIENDGTVKKADIYTEWYSYEDKKWANMVLVSSESREDYISSEPDSVITSSDILGHFVWIPRYKYKISTGGTSTPSTIDIIFENKSTAKSNGNAVDKYFTHPGFTFGDEEVNGIWVAKFETTGTASSPTILPNITSLRTQTISQSFNTAKLFNNYGIEKDSHMMKNTEWATVAYLSHSDYGLNDELRNNNNSNYITGCGSSVNQGLATTECQISYGSDIELLPQSTTGNITGIFDMSGGAWERVMGNYNNNIAQAGFTSMPNEKYYDLYETTSYDTACNGGNCLGHALTETSGWYTTTYDALTSYDSWLDRGGYASTRNGGLFIVDDYNGIAGSEGSFRVVLS